MPRPCCAGRGLQLPGLPVVVLDTLNAGDVWHGAYTQGLVLGLDLAQRVALANVAGALKCEQPWGRLDAPSWDEVQARLATVGSPTAAAFTTQA